MKTKLGDMLLRYEVGSHGKREQGDYLFLSLVPYGSITGWSNGYVYAKVSSLDNIKGHRWFYWSWSNGVREDQLSKDGPCIQQELRCAIESFARKFNCDIGIKVEEENPRNYSARSVALWYQISFYKIRPEIENVWDFIQGFCDHIDRTVLDYEKMIQTNT